MGDLVLGEGPTPGHTALEVAAPPGRADNKASKLWLAKSGLLPAFRK